MILRPYQSAAIDRVRACFGDPDVRRVLVVAPTGAGKTVMLSRCIAGHLDGGTDRRALVIVHRRELVDQTQGKLAACGVRSRVWVETVQALAASGQYPRASLIIVDEAHHYVADTWRESMQRYGETPCVGFTATPERGDGRGLGDLFQRLVVAATPSELQAIGALVPCEVIGPGRRLGPGEIAQRPVDAYGRHAAGQPAIVFSPSVKAAERHCAEFRAAGISAGYVHGSMRAAARDDVVARFRAGSLRVLVNCMVLTEGFDAPRAAVCILARGASTVGAYIQMVGRVLRPSPGKASAMLLDLVGAAHVHGAPDADRVYSLDGKGIRASDGEELTQFCGSCGALWTPPECAECGHVYARAPETVTGDRLERYAAKRAEGETERAATLRRWMSEGAAKGYKPGWALAKYKAVYGTWPRRRVAS